MANRRRQFLGRLARAGVALAAASAGATSAQAPAGGKTYRFTVNGISPPTSANSVLFKKYLDTLATASNGRLRFDFHPGSVLVPPFQALDALSGGSVDMLISNGSYYAGKISLGAYNDLPILTPSYKHTLDLFYRTDIRKVIDTAYREKANATVIQLRPFSPYVWMMAKRKPVRTVADLVGKKIRSGGGIADDALKNLGAVPVKVAPGEFYSALQQGVLDGLLLPVFGLESYKLSELSPIVTQPGISSLQAQLVWMNLDRWNELPDDLKRLIEKTSLDDIQTQADAWAIEDERSMAYARKANIEIFTLPESEQRLLQQKVASVIDTFRQREGERGRELVRLLQSNPPKA